MQGTNTTIPTDNLFFDHKNPRLVEFGVSEETSDEAILELLWDSMGVEELVWSIAASGFFDNERLIVVSEEGKYIVIEGNRRLAAVKAIISGRITELGVSDEIDVPKEIIKELEALPVTIVKSREDAWRYIGFKHVNGPAKWGSYAKAQYIAQVHNEYGISLSDIAQQIGDTSKIVQKLYQALMVLDQAEKAKVFDRGDIRSPRLYFSHLYTGLGYDGIREYIGLKDISEDEKNPIPPKKLKETGELLYWMYGSKKSDTDALIKSQNPDLRYLNEAVKAPAAIAALRAKQPLSVAFEISQPDNEKFIQSLHDAKWALQKAQSYMSTAYDGDEETLRMVEAISEIAEDLFASMHLKREKRKAKEEK